MYKKDYTKFVVLFFLLSTFVLRIIGVFCFESLSNPKTWEYEEIANNILRGEGLFYTYLGTTYRNTSMILYPLFCAGVYRLTNHSFFVLKILQILLSLSTCILIYKIAKKVFNEETGLIGLGLMLFHPGLLIYSLRLHPLTLDAFLFALSLYFLLPILEGQGMFKNGLLAGLAIGTALLTRATIGLFIPAVFISMMKNRRRGKTRPILGISIGILLISSLLLARNYLVFHKLVIFPNDSGVNFWSGNNPQSLGTAKVPVGSSILDVAPDSLIRKVIGLDEFGQNELFYSESWNFIKGNPWQFLRLFVKKIYYFWWFSQTQGLDYPRPWLMAYKFYYSAILLFAVLGLFAARRAVSGEKLQMIYLVGIFLLAISIAQALYYVDGRHRWAVEPFLLMFSAYGLNLIFQKICLKTKI